MSVINKFLARTAANEDDNTDHIGTDTPGSGVATPQPDLQDKRLPGIMSYFGQVRQDSTASLEPQAHSSPSGEASHVTKDLAQHEKSVLSPDEPHHKYPVEGLAAKAAMQPLPDLKHLVISHASPCTELSAAHVDSGYLVSYPTPPASHPPSSHCSDDARAKDSMGARDEVREVPAASCNHHSMRHPKASRSSAPKSDFSEVESQAVKTSARILEDNDQAHLPQSASEDSSCPINSKTHPSGNWFTLDGLKELTRGVMFKSGQSTPTRALSTAQPSQSEGTQSSGRNSHDDGTASGTQTPRGSSGAQVPASKGKVTIKIAEARGLRKCRDPYVVAVFQRSELISGGPRPGENEEPLNAATSGVGGVGGIAIQRQGSDSGRPAMAIPMRSRQSSNTSISDYNTFRNRPRRQSFTNPTWDAEAVL